MSGHSPKLEALDAFFDTLQRWMDEYFRTQDQKGYTSRVEEKERWKVRMWSHRVEFITKTDQWGTQIFCSLLESENKEGLIIEASSLLFDEVAARQSRYLDIWREAMRQDKSFREVKRENDVRITHPDDFRSPCRYAEYILKKVQNYDQ